MKIFAGIAHNINFVEQLDLALLFSKSFSTLNNKNNLEKKLSHPKVFATQNIMLTMDNDELYQMTFGDYEYAICFDGRIFNQNKIRHILLERGCSFYDFTEAELMLVGFLELGVSFFNLVDGHFSCAIWDARDKSLILVRDKLGVNTVFYSPYGGGLSISNSLDTLLKNPNIVPTINKESIGTLILMGPGREPSSAVFSDINQLEPGHYAIYKNNQISNYCYWRLIDKHHKHTLIKTVETVEDLVTKSINKHIDSNKKIGAFLSGGIDSSIITSLLHKNFINNNKELNTFSVDYKNNDVFFKANMYQPDSDMNFIKQMIAYLDNDIVHHNVLLDTNDLISNLYLVVDAKALPSMADIDVSLLLFCNEVKNHIDVAFSGECADEIFGGYPWFTNEKIRRSDTFPWCLNQNYRFNFLKEEIGITEDFVKTKYQNALNKVNTLKEKTTIDKQIAAITYLNTQYFMQTLIERSRTISAMTQLEIRMPFCDAELFEYVYNIPWLYKYHKGYEKGLLREAMANHLPSAVLWRKKSPYPKTHNPSYLNAVVNTLTNILSTDSPLFDIVKKDALQSLLIQKETNIPWYGQLMTKPQTIAYFIQMDYWLKKYGVKIT